MLTEFYNLNSRPGNSERDLLAQKLGIGIDKVKNWFQNRRAKEKKSVADANSTEYQPAPPSKRARDKIFPSCNDLFRRRNS